MSPPKGPQAAFVEDYDEDVHAIIPETRQSANIALRRSRTDLRSALEPMVDIASDSGYSSRTAATVNSTQSAPSGWKSPGSHKNDPVPRSRDLDRVRSIRKERTKDRSHRPSQKEKMQVGVPPSVNHLHHMPPQSPSRPPRGRESSQVRHYPGTCWDCDHGFYHGPAATPEPRPIEYPPYGYMSQPSTPSIQDYPSSPQISRYPPSITQDVHASRPVRNGRSSSYHASTRPGSIHGMSPSMGPMAYGSGSVPRYDLGPPPSSSAYTNAYAMPQYPQPGAYYGLPDSLPHDHRKERSASRTRDPGRARRSSVYEQPPAPPPPPPALIDDFESQSNFDDEESIDIPGPPQPPPQPHPRPRMHPRGSHHDREEDYYRMPPPGAPPRKHKAPPHVIQKQHDVPRRSSTATVVSTDRRSSRSLDMTDLGDALAQYGYHHSSRGTIIPERNQSLRSSRRPSSSYHDHPRPSRASLEGSRHRPPAAYRYEGSEDEVGDKEREAEEYQASRSAKTAPVPVPLTTDALYKAKASHRTESDSGSQKSRTNSSRGSDARTHNGSAVGPKQEDNNIVMTMNGVTMSFTQESMGGKTISVQAAETGALSLNIQGKRPKKYLTGGSDYSGGSGRRRELEDSHRRPRSDRASRRSSKSTYGV